MGCTTSRSTDAVVEMNGDVEETDILPDALQLSRLSRILTSNSTRAETQQERNEDPFSRAGQASLRYRLLSPAGSNGVLTFRNANSSSISSNDGNSNTRNIQDLEQLQLDLATMENLFQTLLTHAYARMSTASDTTPQLPGGSPPADSKAIRNLSIINVESDDLNEESNRECCICFLEHKLDDKVVRLPCGHLYHKPCITEWLQKHCTCPICRWELPTADELFEVGRLERMNSRKMKLKEHDLKRMSIKDLEELINTRCCNDGESNLTLKLNKGNKKNKKELLIEQIKRSTKVDIIIPDCQLPQLKCDQQPMLEYSLSELRAMNISTLKMIMKECSVNCNENLSNNTKEHLIQLLVSSGKVATRSESDNLSPCDRSITSVSRTSTSGAGTPKFVSSTNNKTDGLECVEEQKEEVESLHNEE